MTPVEIADLVAGAAAAIGLIFVGYQTLALRREHRRITKAELLAAHDGITDRMAAITMLFVERSWLRAYFYGSADHAQLDQADRDTVMGVAELLTDFIENTIIHRQVLGSGGLDVWGEYAADVIRSSPAVRDYITANRSWDIDEVGVLLDRWAVEPNDPHATER